MDPRFPMQPCIYTQKQCRGCWIRRGVKKPDLTPWLYLCRCLINRQGTACTLYHLSEGINRGPLQSRALSALSRRPQVDGGMVHPVGEVENTARLCHSRGHPTRRANRSSERWQQEVSVGVLCRGCLPGEGSRARATGEVIVHSDFSTSKVVNPHVPRL